ncbi:MAG: segregation/condensation protein A [Spirochaetota bacterium]
METKDVPMNDTAAERFTVRIKEYEGPLDYLLDLIRRSEKNIYEISLTEIIEQFLAYVRTLAMLDLEVTSDFLVMAAEMHYIKSKMLLPFDYGKDLKDKEDPKQKLVAQLLEYQKFKLSAETLDELQNAEDAIIERRDRQKVLPLTPEGTDDPKDAWQEVGLYELVTAFARMFLFVDKNDLAAMDVSDFNLPDAIELIRIKSRETERFPFAELITERMTRRHLIVFFLAILELIRDRQIAVRQEQQFKEIYIFSVPSPEQTS